MYRAHVAVLQRASHEMKRQKRLIRADSVGSLRWTFDIYYPIFGYFSDRAVHEAIYCGLATVLERP
jgi:hypothetical protein